MSTLLYNTALLCLQGSVFDPRNGPSEWVCEVFVPPMPIDRNIYFCDKRFHTESIEGLFADSNSVPKYLLAVIGGEEVEIWIK
jgi:peptide subunit release factor 1 (eRF1)